jgi:hypothetical protein
MLVEAELLGVIVLEHPFVLAGILYFKKYDVCLTTITFSNIFSVL